MMDLGSENLAKATKATLIESNDPCENLHYVYISIKTKYIGKKKDVEKQKKSHARMVAFSIVAKNLSSRCQSFGL